MRLFHSTTEENASCILHGGFRDCTDYYMTEELHTGVWLSDRPLEENKGPASGRCCRRSWMRRIVSPFEWVEEGKPYREFFGSGQRREWLTRETGALRLNRASQASPRPETVAYRLFLRPPIKFCDSKLRPPFLNQESDDPGFYWNSPPTPLPTSDVFYLRGTPKEGEFKQAPAKIQG